MAENTSNHQHGDNGQRYDKNYLCMGLSDFCPDAFTQRDAQREPSLMQQRLAAAVEGFNAVKDSGERRDFSTGSRRDLAKGKGRYDLLPPLVIRRLAQHFENGAEKYGDHNWKKGQPLSVYLDSGLRHGFNVLELQQDEDHVAAAIWNFSAFMWTAEQIKLGALPAELDDIGWHQTIDSVGPID